MRRRLLATASLILALTSCELAGTRALIAWRTDPRPVVRDEPREVTTAARAEIEPPSDERLPVGEHRTDDSALRGELWGESSRRWPRSFEGRLSSERVELPGHAARDAELRREIETEAWLWDAWAREWTCRDPQFFAPLHPARFGPRWQR